MSLKCDLSVQHAEKGKNASTTIYFGGVTMSVKTVFSGKQQFLVSEYMDKLSLKEKKSTFYKQARMRFTYILLRRYS